MKIHLLLTAILLSNQFYCFHILDSTLTKEILPLVNTHGDEFLCLFHPSDFSAEQLQLFKNQGLIGTEVTLDSNPVAVFITVKER